jgi:hypothetical protein
MILSFTPTPTAFSNQNKQHFILYSERQPQTDDIKGSFAGIHRKEGTFQRHSTGAVGSKPCKGRNHNRYV